MQEIDSAEKKKHRRAIWAIGMVLVIMLTTTVLAGWTTAQVAKKSLENFFGRHADYIAGVYAADMERNVATLQGLRGMWNVTGKFDYASFSTYVNSFTRDQEKPTGFSAYLYAMVLTKDQIEQQVAEVRNEKMTPDVYKNFTIKVEPNDEVLYPLIYVEPTSGRENVIGLNFAALPLRKEAIEYARDNNRLVATRSLTLQTTGEPGFLLFLPLYEGGIVPETLSARREKFAGVVAAAFRSIPAFEQIYGRGETNRVVDFKIYMGESQDEDKLLYVHDPNFKEEEAMFTTTRVVRLLGQAWTIVLYAKPSLSMGGFEAKLPLYVFVAGVFATIATAIYFTAKLAAHIKQDIQLAEGERN